MATADILKRVFPNGLSEGKQIEDNPANFKFTDLGNSERLIYRHGKNLRFVHQWGKWLKWNGTHWKEDITGEIVRLAINTIRQMYHEASLEEDDKERRRITSHANKSESDKAIKSMISLAKNDEGISVTTDQLDSDSWKINCLNGVIDLKSGKLFPHEREILMTKIAPVEYNEDTTCPLWEAFLDRIMGGNKELIEFLQRAIGYSLTGSTNEHVIFILYGSGRNGKSTFVNTIREILGDYADQANPDSFMVKKNESAINNDIASLKGLRFVAAAEGEEGKRLAESFIKQVSSGEAIKARFLRQEYFTFIPQFKLWFSTNHRPIIRGTDKGIWSRIRLIPFAVTIPPEEIDKELPEKLKKEYSGILRWALDGCMKWQQEGLRMPGEVAEATENYRNEMDVMAAFIDDCCVVNPLAKVNATELYKAYTKWCEENGEYTQNQRSFGMRLIERGYDRRSSTGNKKFYFGIGLQGDFLVTDSYPISNRNDKKTNTFTESKQTVTKVTELPLAVGQAPIIEEGEI